ncbi:general substrate transporter [Colletotrichum lupini]|nr:general substrate transporter [Colletotrichum lupini]
MDSESLPPRAQTVEEILASDNHSALSSLTLSLIRLYSILAPACLVVCATNGYDGSVLTGLQGVAAWNREFGSPKGALLGFTSAAYPLGAIISTPFSAFVSDRFGRKWSILTGSSIMIIGVLIQCLSHSIGQFIGGRIVVGFGITMALAAAPVLISELAHPRHRALPAVIQMVFVWFLDESPRWLCYKDRDDEAFSILVKHHGGGDPSDPLVVAEFHEMKVALQLEKQVKDVGPKLFFKTPANRKRLLILLTLAVFGQWSGNGLVSYYLTKIFTSIGITSQREQTMLNGVISTVNYATALFAAALSTKIGRRWMFVGGGIAMWLTFSSLTASIAVYNTTGTTAASQAALAFIFIFYAAFVICLNPLLFFYPTEILPFRLRAMGLSVLVFANKAASFFNQFVNPIGMDSLGWKYYLVYVVWLVIEVAVFYFLYPETRGHSLERMQEVFGEEVKDDGLDEKGSVAKDMRVIEHRE